jgi:hypothetical protein
MRNLLYINQIITQNYGGLGMYRELKKIEFPNEYYIWIWK